MSVLYDSTDIGAVRQLQTLKPFIDVDVHCRSWLRCATCCRLDVAALHFELALLGPMKEAPQGWMQHPEAAVHPVMEPFRQIGRIWTQVAVVRPQLWQKVAVYPRAVNIVGELAVFGTRDSGGTLSAFHITGIANGGNIVIAII